MIMKNDATGISFGSIVALRGTLTRDALAQHYDLGDIALGDPALLMPKFYTPKKPRNKYFVGIVPHISERNLEIFRGLNNESVTIIDVHLDEQLFIDRLCECQYVISSSLHGLILADAYGIKNQWAVFSDLVIGGGFKFMDYYSTTSSPSETPRVIREKKDLEVLIQDIEEASSVKEFIWDREHLLAVFPRGLNG